MERIVSLAGRGITELEKPDSMWLPNNFNGETGPGVNRKVEERQDAKYNLTEGGILKKLLLVAVPIMGTQFMQMTFNLTDMFWLGRVGSGAVAAAGAGGMYMWLSFGFLLIGRMGAEIGVAQCLGRGDKKTALAFSRNAVFIALILGTLFGLASIFLSGQLIGFFNFREKDISRAAADYLRIVGFPMPVVFASAVAVGTYNASGNSRTPFLVNCLGLAINFILDPILIITLDMGVSGAALATTISQLAVGFVMLAGLFFFKDRPFERYRLAVRPEWEKIVRLFKWALPIGVESILFCFLSMLTTRVETSFGSEPVSVSRVGAQIEALSWLIGGGFGSALVAFIGQNYGAGKQERIRRGVKISFITMTLWGSLVTLFLFVAGPKVFTFFLPDPNLAALGKTYLYILAFCHLPMNLEAVGAGAFKGTGRTIQPSLVSVACNAARPVMAWFLSRTSLGFYGVWIGVSISAVMRGTWVCLWYLIAETRKSKPSRAE